MTLPEGAQEIEFNFTARDGKELTGTLTLPQGEEITPVIIFVHGSGPNDRDESIYGNTVFKDLAYRLAEKGIATYRYDKRTLLYAEECANNTNFTVYDETINDAVDAATYLATQSRVPLDVNQFYILGHSLGGLCMPRIAEEFEAAGYIMMAAPVSDLASLTKMQLNYLSQFANEDTKMIYQQTLEELEQLNNLDNLPADQMVMGAYPTYWKDLLSYNPIEVASRITKPVLVLQGEEDYQVPLSEYETWKETYGEKENWTFHSYSGLSHLFMNGSLTENPNQYYLQKQNLDERVTNDIASFIQSNQ